MIKIMMIIWTYILDTWKLHNNQLHKNADQLYLPNYKQADMDSATSYPHCLKGTLLTTHGDMFGTASSKTTHLGSMQSNVFYQQPKATKKQATLCTPNIHNFSGSKLSPPMISNYSEKPTPVWVFFVHLSLREITLKMLSFPHLGTI